MQEEEIASNHFKIVLKKKKKDLLWASLVAQIVKNLPAMQETQVPSPCSEDPLEKEMATQSSILTWEIPWTGEPCERQSLGLQRIGHN